MSLDLHSDKHKKKVLHIQNNMAHTRTHPLNSYTPRTFKRHMGTVITLRRFKFMFLYVLFKFTQIWVLTFFRFFDYTRGLMSHPLTSSRLPAKDTLELHCLDSCNSLAKVIAFKILLIHENSSVLNQQWESNLYKSKLVPTHTHMTMTIYSIKWKVQVANPLGGQQMFIR